MSVFQLRTFSDLVTSIREELGIASTDTTAINRIKRDVNIIYDEIVSRKKWNWLSGSIDLTLPAYVNAGTASVVQNSAVVTLTVAPAASKSGYFFSIDGYAEIYRINNHTAGSVTVNLANEFTGSTNPTSSYKIWTNRIPLPTDCKETNTVWHDTYRRTLENIGQQEYRRVSTQLARNEGAPTYYYTGDYVDPAQTSSISSLPAVATRSSSLMRKSIVFASAIPSAVVNKVTMGDPVRLRISSAGHPSYNGDVLISNISTTSVANDTLTYTGVMEYTESAVADLTMSVLQLDQEQDYDRYRELFLYPCLSNAKQTIHVDYFKDALPLDNDSDEPVIPREDRSVIRFGALHLSWSRVRNAPEAQRNLALYEKKLAQMEGKWEDSLETPRLIPSKSYLSAKRSQVRRSALESNYGPLSAGGSAGGSTATGVPNRAAIFGNDGVLVASPTVSSTELSYLDNVTSNVQTQLDAKQSLLVNSAGLAAALSDETGTGQVVFNTSPTLVAPALGTPSALVGTNITGTAAGLTAGTVTTNANLTGEVTSVGNAATLTNSAVIGKVITGYVSGAGTVSATDTILQAIQKLNGNDATNANLTGVITSVGNATSIASQTGTGTKFVVDTSPTLVTPNLGTPTALVGTNITGTASGLTAGNVTTNANLTGDVTSVGNASTIASNVVTNAKLSTMATASFKGRTTAGTGNVEDLTATQATAILNNMVGDSGSGGTKGLVPAPASGDAAAAKFLKADGTWAAPAGVGTVTSVAAAGPTGIATWSSAITTSGTLTQTLSTQSANTSLMGPASGSAATPAFRALVRADISSTYFAPFMQRVTSGSGTYQRTFAFAVSGANATSGAVYTSGGFSFVVQTTIASGTTFYGAGSSAPSYSGTLTKFSGTGDSTINFTASAACTYLRVRMVGGGGGSGGVGTGGNGGNGGNTTFGSSFLQANGGNGSSGANTQAKGTGGTTSIATGAFGTALTGSDGNNGTALVTASGGQGGSTPFGGGGAGGIGNAGAGNSPVAGSGAGAGGAGGSASAGSAGGGGGGGYLDVIVPNPATSYTYSVGAAGTAGTGTNAGAAGATGCLELTEYYQ